MIADFLMSSHATFYAFHSTMSLRVWSVFVCVCVCVCLKVASECGPVKHLRDCVCVCVCGAVNVRICERIAQVPVCLCALYVCVCRFVCARCVRVCVLGRSVYTCSLGRFVCGFGIGHRFPAIPSLMWDSFSLHLSLSLSPDRLS